jgi:hypothetical protein
MNALRHPYILLKILANFGERAIHLRLCLT